MANLGPRLCSYSARLLGALRSNRRKPGGRTGIGLFSRLLKRIAPEPRRAAAVDEVVSLGKDDNETRPIRR